MMHFTSSFFVLTLLSLVGSAIATPTPAPTAPHSEGEVLPHLESRAQLYNCKQCHLSIVSDFRVPIRDAKACFRQVAISVLSDFLSDCGDATCPGEAVYHMSPQKAVRGTTDDGSFAISKGVSFNNLAFTPDEHNHGFHKDGYSCSNGLTASARCYHCHRA